MIALVAGLRCDVIGLKDDDAFYFSLIRRGQKTLHLRSFSPVQSLELSFARLALAVVVLPCRRQG